MRDTTSKVPLPGDNGPRRPAYSRERSIPVSVGKLSERIVIDVRAGELSAIADRGEAELIAADVPFFQRSGRLVRPVVETVEASDDRKTTVAQLRPVDATYMRDMLGRVAHWRKEDRRRKKSVPIDPPFETAATILARAGEWHFPVIAGVITTPTMRPDGTVLDRPGYDAATRLLLVDPPPMPPIPEHPTRDEALAALALLEGLLTEFPLVDDVARAVALSAIITPVVRGAFPVAPMHAVTAPVNGSGKSYFLDTVSAIAIGQLMPVMSAGASEEETEKRVGSALLAGQPLLSIDNLNGRLRSAFLCQAIERPVCNIRILGKSEQMRIEARGTTLFANGNNIVIVGDLCRRTIIAALDPEVERPELRVFEGNPVATVLADRGRYIAAALTVCRAYVAAGRPNRAPRLASFEGWSDIARSALIWLGKADPVDSMASVRDEDPELLVLLNLLTAWVAAVGAGTATTVKDLLAISGETEPNSYNNPVLLHPDLNAAVRATIGERRQPDATALGYWLRGRKGRVVNGMCLMNRVDRNGVAHWWVKVEGVLL